MALSPGPDSFWNKLNMKNYQKNATYPSVPVSCMKNQVIPAVQVKHYNGLYKELILEMHLNLWFKWTSNQMNTSCISSNSITSSCHVHASYCCIYLPIDSRHCSFSIGLAPETVPEYLSVKQCLPCWFTRKANPLVHSDKTLLSRSCSQLLH